MSLRQIKKQLVFPGIGHFNIVARSLQMSNRKILGLTITFGLIS